jgi:hypothetical protein
VDFYIMHSTKAVRSMGKLGPASRHYRLDHPSENLTKWQSDHPRPLLSYSTRMVICNLKILTWRMETMQVNGGGSRTRETPGDQPKLGSCQKLD